MAGGRPPRILTTSTGESDELLTWAKRTGIHPNTIRHRLQKGWSVDDALKISPREAMKLVIGDENMTISEWAQRTGINEHAIRARLRDGWSAEEAMEVKQRPDKSDMIEWGGEKYTLLQLSRKTGLTRGTLKNRLDRGWSVEDAATTPPTRIGRRFTTTIEWQGREYTIGEIAKKFGLTGYQLYDRLNMGWDIEKALTTPVQKRKRK